MLINYLDELNEDKISNVPEPLLKVLSGKLPDGLKYENINDGICGVVPDNESLCISGFEPVLTDELKNKINNSDDMSIIQRYAYNSQKTIEFKPINEGEMIINGNTVKIDDFIIDPRHSKYFKDGKFLLIPEKMNEKASLSIGVKDNVREMEFERIPDNSIDTICFESFGNDSLKCTIKFNETSQKIKIHFSYCLDNVRKVKEIVDILEIFYAFKNNKGMINDCPVNISEFDDDCDFNEDTLWFWKRVYELEQNLNTSFDISEGNYGKYITEELVEDIELLYKSFVQHKPIRINSRIDKINGECGRDEDVISAEKNTQLLLRFQLMYIFNIFGKEYKYPALIYVYNAKYVDKNIKDGKYTIYFEDKNDKEKMYYSVMLFENTESMIVYEENNKEIYEEFKFAEPKNIIKLI